MSAVVSDRSAVTPEAPAADVPAVGRTIVLGTVAALLILLFSSMRGWPFHTLTAAPWYFQLSAPSGAVKYLFLAGFYLAVALLCLAWVRLLRAARAKAVNGRSATIAFLAWSLPLLVASPLFSGDVYVYIIDGLMISRGLDPYAVGVSALGPAPEVLTVHPLWRDTPSMYGPIFMRLVHGITLVTGGDMLTGVTVLRVVTYVAIAGAGVAVWSLAKRLGRTPGEAFTFAMLNPVSLMHLVGGAHNDALMLALMVAGLAAGIGAMTPQRKALAIVLCVAAAGVKIPGLAGVMILGWIWAGGSSVPHRLWSATKAGVVGVVGFVLVTVVCGLGFGWTHSLDVPGLAHPLLAPANAIGIGIGNLFGIGTLLNSVTRGLATLLSLALAVFFVLRTGRTDSASTVLRAAGWSLIALAWLGAAVYPWYLVWGLTLIALCGAGRMERYVIPTVVVLSFVIAPGGYGNLDLVGGAWRTVIALALTAFVFLAVRHVVRLYDFSLREELVRLRREFKSV